MKKLITILSTILILAGCGSDEQPATSESLQKAGEHAKEAVKYTGEAISDTASTAKQKWEEANVGRFEELPNEDSNLPQTSIDTQELKETLSTAKDKVLRTVKDVATKQAD